MTAKNKSIAALVLGILSIVFSFIPFANLISIIPGIVGIVFAAGAMKEGSEDGKGIAIGGLVCSIIGVVFAVPATICGICSLCVNVVGAGAAASFAGALADAASQMN